MPTGHVACQGGRAGPAALLSPGGRRLAMNNSEGRQPVVCVYAASSKACHPAYHDAARRLGVFLAERHFTITYGGGGAGLMGALADGALSRGGRITGVLPTFMNDLRSEERRVGKECRAQ